MVPNRCKVRRLQGAAWRTVGKNGTPTSQAKRFSLELGPAQAPLLYKEGKGASWASASAETLGTKVAFHACDIFWEAGGSAVARISTGTDNQANDSFSKKGSYAKRPLGLILMQLATSRSPKILQLSPSWRPREETQEADDLMSGKFEDFAEWHRVNFTWEQVHKGC
ncbi:unnamed protein product [Polarella glacialis]|uniref:Uncharacterized protein n=1 Tax=Polarella glacialis TaxID=89957 RepID=A0A813L3G1_POLGL|nr:unnamed protein product [Polarella glacialis]